MKPHEWTKRPLETFPWDQGAAKIVGPDGKLRIVAVDVQADGTHIVTREYESDGTSRLVNFGKIQRRS